MFKVTTPPTDQYVLHDPRDAATASKYKYYNSTV